MVWFRIDDSMWSHPKVYGLTGDAGWLWVRAGLWSSQQLTDGYVPRGVVIYVLRARERDAALLVAAGLWETADDGWQFHDWGEYQPTRDTVLARREADRQRKARAGKKGADVRWDSKRNPDGIQSDSARNPDGLQTDSIAPGPARPDPALPDPEKPSSRRSASNRSTGSRLDEDWAPSDVLRQWTIKNAPSVNVSRELEVFRDYWLSKPGAAARKTDWDRTWRNWVRKAHDTNLLHGWHAHRDETDEWS